MKSRFAIFAIRDRKDGVDLQISETDIPIGVPMVWKRFKRKNGVRMGVKYLREDSKYRNFLLRITKKRRGLFLRPIYFIEITDGVNTITVREEKGFRVKTNIEFPKPIIEK